MDIFMLLNDATTKNNHHGNKNSLVIVFMLLETIIGSVRGMFSKRWK